MIHYLIQFEIILLKLNEVKFKLRCVDSNISNKSNRLQRSQIKIYQIRITINRI